MTRIIKAFFFSLAGLKAAWREETAFREEALLACVMIPAAFFLAPDRISLVLMIGSVLLVLIIELLNTAIESAVNHTGTDLHPMAKKAKDTASAAVLIALVMAGFIWICCLI